jgi:hypothetical protein
MLRFLTVSRFARRAPLNRIVRLELIESRCGAKGGAWFEVPRFAEGVKGAVQLWDLRKDRLSAHRAN